MTFAENWRGTRYSEFLLQRDCKLIENVFSRKGDKQLARLKILRYWCNYMCGPLLVFRVSRLFQCLPSLVGTAIVKI